MLEMFADKQVGLNVQCSFFDTVMTIGITRTLLFLKKVSQFLIPSFKLTCPVFICLMLGNR